MTQINLKRLFTWKFASSCILAVILISVLLITINFFTKGAIANKIKMNELNKELKNSIETAQNGAPPINYPEISIYDGLHHMTNPIIVAGDGQVWGELGHDPEQVKIFIDAINLYDYKDKDVLVDMLKPWLEKDYTNAAELHNYVWEKLGGTVGKAIDVKEQYKKKK